MRKTKLVPRVDSYPQRVNHVLLSHVKQYAGSGNGSPSLWLSWQPCAAEGETMGVETQQNWARSVSPIVATVTEESSDTGCVPKLVSSKDPTQLAEKSTTLLHLGPSLGQAVELTLLKPLEQRDAQWVP